MKKNEVFEKVKAYCRQQYDELEEEFENQYMKDIPRRTLVDWAANRAYGAVMFVTNDLYSYEESEKLVDWWNNYMNDKFWRKKFEVTEQTEPLFIKGRLNNQSPFNFERAADGQECAFLALYHAKVEKRSKTGSRKLSNNSRKSQTKKV